MQKEINKFLKKITAAQSRGNKKECIELYNIVGGLYSEISAYDEAIYHHEKALDLCKILGDQMGVAHAYRFIGEAKAALGNFYQAIECTKKYLDLAQRASDKVETQRAWTTLGRVYLMQAQDLKDKSNIVDEQTKEAAREAEKKFQRALNLAESVRDQVDAKEYGQMTSGLLINLGLVKDICGEHAGAVQKLNQASEICKLSKPRLKEDLFRCQIVLATIYRQKNNVEMAVRKSEEALETARSIGKKLLICDALIERGLVNILQRRFKDGKRCFAQAYLEKSPNEEDHTKAIRLTKLAHLISVAHENVAKHQTASETRLKLCDQLGDLFVAIDFYKFAVEYYKEAFNVARVLKKPKSELARIVYSLGETYADAGQNENALLCYEKELNLRRGNDVEQCQSLIKIAQISERLNKDPKEVCERYEEALAKAGRDTKLIYSVLKDYVPYMFKKSCNLVRRDELDNTLKNLRSYPEVMDEVEAEEVEDAYELEDEVPNVDDIITDDDENDEVMVVGRRKARGATKFKPNEVGETPLHEACIKGDLKRVKALIAQGHEINPRDNAGWIPLHEACNHGHGEIVEYLIEKGADVNYRGLKGMTPLHDAATNGHLGIMRALMCNGANVTALTDTGETVLGCLRDYKNRNYDVMSNSELSEYKYIEAELKNQMDKCGFNLMELNRKSTGKNNNIISRASSSSRTGSISGRSTASSNNNINYNTHNNHQSNIQLPSTSGSTINNTKNSANNRQQLVRSPPVREIPVRPRNIVSMDSDEEQNQGVRDYRVVMGTLKRKRNLDNDNEPTKSRASSSMDQPATYSATSGVSTSAPTREWIVDDVSRNQRIINRRANLARELFGTEEDEDENVNGDEDEEEGVDEDESDDEAMLNMRVPLPRQVRENDSDESSEVEIISSDYPSQEAVRPYSPRDDFLFDDNLASEQSAPVENRLLTNARDNVDRFPEDGPFSRESSIRTEPMLPSFGSDDNCSRLSSASRMNNRQPNYPLKVSIDGRKIMIPVKEESATIKWLRETVEERYSIVAGAKPVVSLSVPSDPDCLLFDEDLVKDVIMGDNVIAKIESWNLESMMRIYIDECIKDEVRPCTAVRIEMDRLDSRFNSGQLSKLDWSFTRWPRQHMRYVLTALMRRSIREADFRGASCFFADTTLAQILIDTVSTWTGLVQLNLSQVGLRRSDFETICEKGISAELRTLDLSYNIIIYKKVEDFKTAIAKLKRSSAKLKLLDLRANLLQFLPRPSPPGSQGDDGEQVAPANNEQASSPPNVVNAIVGPPAGSSIENKDINNGSLLQPQQQQNNQAQEAGEQQQARPSTSSPSVEPVAAAIVAAAAAAVHALDSVTYELADLEIICSDQNYYTIYND